MCLVFFLPRFCLLLLFFFPSPLFFFSHVFFLLSPPSLFPPCFSSFPLLQTPKGHEEAKDVLAHMSCAEQ